MRSIAKAITLALLAAPAWTAQYYVDTANAAASDANAGTSATAPWRTIGKAAATLVAGDTVDIAAGTYAESPTTRNAGTAAAPITLRAAAGARVVVQGLVTLANDRTVLQGIEISGDSLRLEGSWCRVVGCTVHDASTFGVFIHGAYNVLRGNTIFDNGSSWGGQVTTGWGTAGGHIVFEDNDVSDPDGRGEDLMQYLNHDFLARGNRFHDLGSNGRHNDCYQSGGGEYGIWMIGNRFERLGNVQYFMVGPSGDRDHVWRQNLFWGMIGWGFNGAPANMRVVGNTFATAEGGYGYGGDGYSRDNIYNAWGTQSPYGASSADYNLVNPGGAWNVVAQPHDLWAVDPAFVDFAGHDYRLSAASPCIDRGTWPTRAVGAGGGTQLHVADARLFVDGFGLTDGDAIQLQGQAIVAHVVAADYAANVLTLDRALTWSDGQGVCWPYAGAAPDIGAFEYGSTTQGDQPPTVALTSPAAGATYVAPATIALAANAADADGSVAKVDFYDGATLIATRTSAPYAVAWSGVAAGSHTLTARASDDLGTTTTSAPVVVTVTTQHVAGATTIWDALATPAHASDADNQAIEVGVKFRSDVAGTITAIRFYKGTANTGAHVGHLWTRGGAALGSVAFANESGSGWQQATFATPIAIQPNTTYVASYHTDVGHYAGDNGAFAGHGVDRGPLHALADGVDGGDGVYRYGASAFPTDSWQASNYWVDVVFVPTSSGVTSGQWYRLVAKHSGKLVDVEGVSTADGANVHQWGDWNGPNQAWRVDAVGDGSYTLVSQNSGKALDVAGWSTADGGNVQQWTLHGGANQRWTFTDTGGGWFRITNLNSGKVLDVAGAATGDGANIQQWTWWGGDNQRWELVPVPPSGSG